MIRGFACGVFDLFHAGHVLMLKECKENCDYLVVGVNKGSKIDSNINPDKKSPIYSCEDRKMILQACRFVDEVVVYQSEEELIRIMRSGNFQIRFLGDDYRGRAITDSEAIPKIHYTDRSHGKSSSKVRFQIRDK